MWTRRGAVDDALSLQPRGSPENCCIRPRDGCGHLNEANEEEEEDEDEEEEEEEEEATSPGPWGLWRERGGVDEARGLSMTPCHYSPEDLRKPAAFAQGTGVVWTSE